MKNRIIETSFIGIFLIIGIAFIGSCDKETVNPYPSATPLGHIDSFLENNQPTEQIFTITADQGGTITGIEGTKITVPQNAFQLPNGTIATGNITIKLQEVNSPADMIYMDMPTVSDGQLLVSGGELTLSVEQNGTELELAPGQQLDFRSPVDVPDNQMRIFISDGTDPNFNWSQSFNQASPTVVTPVVDSTGDYYYYYQMRELYNFINLDYFLSDPRPKTEVIVKLPETYTPQDTKVFMYIPSANSMAKVYHWNNTLNYYLMNGSYKLPIGLEVDLVAIHSDGTDKYLSHQKTTITQAHEETLSFQKATDQQIKQVLANL